MALEGFNPLAGRTTFTSITPSDTVALPRPCQGVYVGSIGSGAVVVAVNGAGTPVTFSGVVVGATIPTPGCIRINSTSTTATLLIAIH